jgi:hypothetical protein
MTWPEKLLDQTESLIQQLVGLQSEDLARGGLATRLDVLERVIELLRLRSGRIENTMSVNDLLHREVEVFVNAETGALWLSVGTDFRDRRIAEVYRRHPDLHVALLLFLLHSGREESRIGDDLYHFIISVKNGLHPSDVETTRTGVVRIATTTRDAARALRQHGLLRDIDETRGRRWELSVLGVLVASELTGKHPELRLPERHDQGDGYGQIWALKRLAPDVEEVVRRFAHPTEVRRALSELVDPDKDVVISFDVVAQTLAHYCAGLEDRWRAMDSRGKVKGARDLQAEADAMLRAVSAAIIPSRFALEVNKSLSMRQLPRLGH